MLSLLVNYIVLGVAITHLAYILIDSYLMAPYRRWMEARGPYAKELSTCVVCTSTQLALALCWLIGPLFPSSNPFTATISYLVSALFLAKLSLLLGSLFEVVVYIIGVFSTWVSNGYYSSNPEPSEPFGNMDLGPLSEPSQE